MMRVLILTNVYPSKMKPYAGIFVKNQYDFMCSHHVGQLLLDIFFLRRSFTGAVGGVFKYAVLFVRFLPIVFRRYDVIHLHFFFPLIWFCAFYRLFHPRTRLVVTLHGTDVINRFHSSFSRRLHARLASSVDYVNAVGNEVGQEFFERLGRRVDGVFAAGIDDRIFNPAESAVDKNFDFVFVGSFYEKKGFDLYVAALELMSPGLSLCFIGSGHLEHLLGRLDGRHSVTLLNNLSQPEIAMRLRKSRFIVLPSRSEPFGLVVSEAMYCGVPAIVSHADGLVMQVVNGDNGFITENNPPALAACMQAALLLDDERYSRMSKAAAASNHQYSLSAVCQRLLGIYGGASA